MSQINWSDLFSGIVGSVVGAGATVWATNSTIKATVRETQRLNEERLIEQRKLVLSSLIAELALNVRMAQTDTKLEHKTQFIVTAWEIAKTQIAWFSVGAQAMLLDVYSLIAKHNDLVLYDRHALDFSSGSVNAAIFEIRKSIEIKSKELLSAFEQLQKGME